MSAGIVAVIVCYRAADLALDALGALLAQGAASRLALHVVLVDNASPDGSGARLRQAISERGADGGVSVLELPRNRGFAAGCNAGFRAAIDDGRPCDRVLLLNPDARPRAGALAALVEALERRPEVGAAGSRLEDEAGDPLPSAFRFPTLRGEWERAFSWRPLSRLLAARAIAAPPPAAECEVEWLSGAALLVRRAALEAAGLLDERFFLYYEDADLCLRLRRAGWRSLYVPRSRVVHRQGASARVGESAAALRRDLRRRLESRRAYFLKHGGRLRLFACDLGCLAGYALLAARRGLLRRPLPPAALLLPDLARALLARPAAPSEGRPT